MITSTAIKVQTVTIEGPVRHKGSTCKFWNVSVDGVPFGQIWTFIARAEIHGFHAKTLAGEYKLCNTFDEAETFMRGCA